VGKKTRTHRVALQRLIAVAAVAISVVFVLAFGGQILEIYRLRSTLAIADGRLEQLQREQVALEATRTYVASDAYVERVARAELNMIRPGDRRVIIIPKPLPAPTPAAAAPGQEVATTPSYLSSW